MAKDWTWLKTQSEGQFLERKSFYERSGIPPRPCPIKEVVRAVAEALVAMANADGGTVALGIEDDGTVSGVPDRYDRDAIFLQLHHLVRPQLNFRFEQVTLEGQRVWVFETDWSVEVHQLTDGRYLLRVGEQSLPFPAGDIEAMKQSRLQRATEVQFLSDATLADLETDLLLELAHKSGLTLSVEDTLVHFKLAEKTAAQLRLTLAAVLLFAKDPIH